MRHRHRRPSFCSCFSSAITFEYDRLPSTVITRGRVTRSLSRNVNRMLTPLHRCRGNTSCGWAPGGDPAVIISHPTIALCGGSRLSFAGTSRRLRASRFLWRLLTARSDGSQLLTASPVGIRKPPRWFYEGKCQEIYFSAELRPGEASPWLSAPRLRMSS